MKFDSPLKRKGGPGRIHLLRTSNGLLRKQHDIPELVREQVFPDFRDRWLLA